MDRHSTVTLDRNKAAAVANLWGMFVARLLRPSVERDAHATAALVAREQRAFVAAVCAETDDPFLRGHAEDFAQALEESLFGESGKRLLAENKAIQREEREQARRGKVKVAEPGIGQVPNRLDKGQRVLTLRRPAEDGV